MCGGVCVCVGITYTSEDLDMTTHRLYEDLVQSEDLNTGARSEIAQTL